MKYLIVVLMTLCLLLSACKAPAEPGIPKDNSTQQQDQTAPDTDYPTPPELPPAGTDSDAPPPAEGPEGLPTPAL